MSKRNNGILSPEEISEYLLTAQDSLKDLRTALNCGETENRLGLNTMINTLHWAISDSYGLDSYEDAIDNFIADGRLDNIVLPMPAEQEEFELDTWDSEFKVLYQEAIANEWDEYLDESVNYGNVSVYHRDLWNTPDFDEYI